jgi:hypothetical protein
MLIQVSRLLLDVGLVPGIELEEDGWAPPGPGAKACLLTIFGSDVRGHEIEAIAWLHSVQDKHWKRIGYTPTLAPGQPPGVSASDIEHALCEVTKWFRSAMPWLSKTHKLSPYTPSGVPLPPVVLPAKWAGGRAAPRPKEVHATSDTGSYEITAILSQRGTGEGAKCLVRWKTYDAWYDSWVRADELEESAPVVLKEWRTRRTAILERIAAVKKIKMVAAIVEKAKAQSASLRRRSS